MSGVTATYKVSDVFSYVKRQFGDESGVQITIDDIIRWINVAQNEIFRRNEPVKKTSTADLIGGQYSYTFPDDILQVEAIRVNNKRLKYMSFQEAEEYLVQNDPDNNASGQPELWYEYGGTFMLYPKPQLDQTDGIQIFYVPAPTQVTASTSTLAIPNTYYNRILEHVLSQAYELDENFDAAQIKVAQFADGMNSLNGDNSVEYSTYPRITVLDEDM